MRRAHERDAATKGKFFFRNNIGFARPPSQEGCFPGNTYRPCADEPQNGHEEMTILAILEGKVRDSEQDTLLILSLRHPCRGSICTPRASAPALISVIAVEEQFTAYMRWVGA